MLVVERQSIRSPAQSKSEKLYSSKEELIEKWIP